MDRQTLREHLIQAQNHVVAGEQNVARQRRIVAELEHDGHDATTARKLLASFEALHRLQVLDRDRAAPQLQSFTADRPVR